MKSTAKIDSTPETEAEIVEVDADTTATTVTTKERKSEGTSTAMRDIQALEDVPLRDLLEQLGPKGAFKVHVHRVDPTEFTDPATGKRVKTNGKLNTYEEPIDEEFIQQRHGGGRYQLRFTKRTTKGDYKFIAQRTIDVAGDPRLDDIPRTTPLPNATAAAGAPQQDTGLVNQVIGLMKDELDRAHDRANVPPPKEPRGIDPAMEMLITQLRQDALERSNEIHEMRRQLATLQSQKPPEDPIKEKILGSLIDGESGRIAVLRQTHESELRQLRENHRMDMQIREEAHQREVASLKASYEREIATLRAANETTTIVTRESNAMQVKILEADARRSERDLEALRREVAELRAKKDKSFLEQIKEIEALKDAIGLDDQEKSGVDKIIEVISSPAVAEVAGRIMGGQQAVAAAAPQQVVQAPRPQAPQLVQDPNGTKYWAMPDGKGGVRLAPAKKKPKVIPATVNPDGTQATPEIQLPEIDAAALANLIGYLERAYSNKMEPEIVAQSGKSSVPDAILTWIREHDTDQTSGVDLFLSKVAKLPASSPLASQAGKNWIRRVGKALIE